MCLNAVDLATCRCEMPEQRVAVLLANVECRQASETVVGVGNDDLGVVRENAEVVVVRAVDGVEVGLVERIGRHRERVCLARHAASERPGCLLVGNRFERAGVVPEQASDPAIDGDVSVTSPASLRDRQEVEANLVQLPRPIKMKRKPTPHSARQCRRASAAPCADRRECCFCLKAAVAHGDCLQPWSIVGTGNPLSVELLEAVRERWRDDGAPTAEVLRPGLSDAEIDALTAPLGLRLPPEARTLWSWRDGAELGRNVQWMGKGWVPLPLARAVSLTQEYRALLWDDDMGVVWRDVWRKSFLVLTRPDQPDVLVIDCGDGRPTSPVHSVILQGAATTVIADSVGELVERWLRVMEQRLAHFDRSQSRWRYEWDAIDDAWRI